jgi:hypothetical protein
LYSSRKPFGKLIGEIGIADDFDFEPNIAIRLLLKMYCQNNQFLKEALEVQLRVKHSFTAEANQGQHLTDPRRAFQILTSCFKLD